MLKGFECFKSKSEVTQVIILLPKIWTKIFKDQTLRLSNCITISGVMIKDTFDVLRFTTVCLHSSMEIGLLIRLKLFMS